MIKITCSNCNNLLDTRGRYCLKCHANYMKQWRKSHPLNTEQRIKANCRAITNMSVKRGKLVKLNCQKCGSIKSETHHFDYSKPLEVNWLCRKHHLELHRKKRS